MSRRNPTVPMPGPGGDGERGRGGAPPPDDATPGQGDAPRVGTRDAAAQPTRDDRELMERIALRQPEALAGLYDRYRNAVYGICARVLGAGADAEEILEEVFFEVWQRPDRYDPERSAPLSYLAVMARSRSIDRIRATRRRANAHERSRLFEVAPDEKDALESVVALELRKRARAALATLRPDERNVVTLFYWGGLSHAEIAEREDIPLGTVKTRIRRGLIRLRQALDDRDDESAEKR